MRTVSSDSDVVSTPQWIVRDMLNHFQPTGSILDPCRGQGAFYDLIPDADWCEIVDGRDFFDWTSRVDWVIGNPPYSIIRAWLRHTYTVADNILYLMPVRNLFSGYGTIREAREFGGVPAIRLYGTGTRCGFPMGNAIAAVHLRRGHHGPTTFTDHRQETE